MLEERGTQKQELEGVLLKDWGKVWAVSTNLQGFIRTIWANLGITDLGIIGWLSQTGDEHLYEAMRYLGRQYLRYTKGIMAAEISHGAKWNTTTMKWEPETTLIRKVSGSLFVGDGEVVAWRPLSAWTKWENVFEGTLDHPPLDPGFRDYALVLRDFLLTNPDFFPGDWYDSREERQVFLFPDLLTRNLYTLELETATGRLSKGIVHPGDEIYKYQKYIILDFNAFGEKTGVTPA